MDAGHDADAGEAPDSTPDGSEISDAPSADADATIADAPADNTLADSSANVEAAAEAEADAGADAEGDAEAGPNAAQQFVTQYAQALCNGTYGCCERYDAGFDDAAVAACQAQVLTGNSGWESTLPTPGAFARGQLDVTDAAAGCLQALDPLSCGTFSAAQYQAVTNDCFGVFAGTIALGAGGCVSSFECLSGYCALPTDGGTGTCTALVGAGGTCATQDMCSQASLAPTMYCTTQVTGNATGTCATLLDDGSNCAGADMVCASGLCAANNFTQCGGSLPNQNVGDAGICP